MADARLTPCGCSWSTLHATKKYAPCRWISKATVPTNAPARASVDRSHFCQRGKPASGPRQPRRCIRSRTATELQRCHLILDEMKDRWTGLEPGERPYREAALFYGEYRYRPSEEFA